mmetsp:Transcript_12474/g.16401  ORF Transcript_12474/g.16401 Transcript_12474/m.16401 type:complete len:85 (+) Transcript_12474:58-312(+)
MATQAATMAPLTLFRNLLRQSKTMKDYNFRTYAERRVKAGFLKNRTLQGEAATAALVSGMEQLEVLRRQAVLSQLYPSARSVME